MTSGAAEALFELGLSIELDFSISLFSDLSGTGFPLLKMDLPKRRFPGLALSQLNLMDLNVLKIGYLTRKTDP